MQFDSAAITQENYRIFVDFLKIKLGHDLGEGKEYLIENRLNPVCEAQKIANVNELAREIKIMHACTLMLYPKKLLKVRKT